MRFTARVSESPGTKLLVVTGTVKPCCVTSIERVPDEMVEAIGVLLSVKLPKVPRPATAAAAPRTPSEPTTLRAVGLETMFLAFMTGSPCVRCPCHRLIRRQGERSGANRRPPASDPQGIHKGCAQNPRIEAFPRLSGVFGSAAGVLCAPYGCCRTPEASTTLQEQ